MVLNQSGPLRGPAWIDGKLSGGATSNQSFSNSNSLRTESSKNEPNFVAFGSLIAEIWTKNGQNLKKFLSNFTNFLTSKVKISLNRPILKMILA